MRLSNEELYTPRVEGYLEEQAVLRRAMPDATVQPLVVRVIYSSYFYLGLAGAIGALTAWGILEPFFDESGMRHGGSRLVGFMLFPTVAAFVGLFLGAVEGIMCRNFLRAAMSAAVGLGIGFVGGLVALIPAGLVFAVMTTLAVQVGGPPGPDDMPHGFGLLLLIMGRGAAWAIVSIPAGIGQGIAIREKKVFFNGMLGAVLGGLLGGLMFDPVYMLLSHHGSAALSRGVGFCIIGTMVGIFVGLVEQWTKTAWLLMRSGPLAGKQFVLHRNPTVIGSAPKADIYIFKDAAIEPRHALIHNRGGRFEIEDCGSKDGTYVNGMPVTKRILQNGDKIVMGKTMLDFSLKEST
jgi:hypothetical protein